MPRPTFRCGVLVGALLALAAGGETTASGVVSLTFSDKDSTPTSTTVAAGSSFTFGVFLNESATTDDVTALDYRLQASASSVFELTSRTSTAVMSPYVADNLAAVAPVVLSPTNGKTNLGGNSPDNNPDIRGIYSADVADYNFLVLSGTTPGTYTMYFTAVGTGTGAGTGPGGGPALVLPTYSAGYPGYVTAPVASDNSFTVTVTAASPEPSATLALLGPSAALFGVARPRRRRHPRGHRAAC